MVKFSKKKLFGNLLTYAPLLLLFISVLNEFDFNYLELKYFSFNFPFILIFYWSLKKSESLGYLFICVFAAYLKNITLHPSVLKDWLFFLLTILVVNSLVYSLLVLFFSLSLDYNDLLVNLMFTFLFYVIFANIFEVYQKIFFGNPND